LPELALELADHPALALAVQAPRQPPETERVSDEQGDAVGGHARHDCLQQAVATVGDRGPTKPKTVVISSGGSRATR
jgi:hypothetical protein